MKRGLMIAGALTAGVIAGVLGCRALANAAPYVSCPGGYIAHSLKDCPPWPPKHLEQHPPVGGGGGSVVGELLDGLGLGGLL